MATNRYELRFRTFAMDYVERILCEIIAKDDTEACQKASQWTIRNSIWLRNTHNMTVELWVSHRKIREFSVPDTGQ